MSYIAVEDVAKAKEMDLLTYLRNYEPQELVHVSGNTYCTREHDSLRISNGKWCWFSQEIGGRSALDYLIKVKGVPFTQAVEIILGREAEKPPVFYRQKERKHTELLMPELSETTDRVEKYLYGRGIHPVIIRYCVENKLIFETANYHNAVFVGHDKDGKARYGALRSTVSSYKGELSGSDKHRPRKNSFQPTFLDAEQMQKLFEVVKGTRLELPVLVAAFYGLRRGEVLGLKWDAIDFNRGTLTIKRTVTEATIDGTMRIIEQDSAKTKSSLRTLPLVGSFRDYFQKVKEAQELNKKVCGNCYNYEYDGYVFVNELGERMRPSYLTEHFPKYIAKHGMPKMRFHDLRHSCASLLLANGVPLKQIQEWLGHSDFSTTANIYAHLDYRSKISSAQAWSRECFFRDQMISGAAGKI